MINSSITLDAYLPSFDASSFFCMCEVKILSTQKFGSLLISQESTIIPPSNCGLQLKIANATGVIRTVHCSYVGKAEYILIQGSSIVISLANISKTWLEGYCFHFSLRFGMYLAVDNSLITLFKTQEKYETKNKYKS